MEIPSKLLEAAVQELAQLPSIGKKSALRLALHLLKQPTEQTQWLATALQNMREQIQYCQSCHNISDSIICSICSNPGRNKELLCVVEDITDVMAIENTGMYHGMYHVLGGKISPIDGIGPNQLHIANLVRKLQENPIVELIFALSSTMEGDTTIFYIYKQIKNMELKISTIAKGIAIGDELQYADEITLGRSLQQRIPFENNWH